MSRQIVQQRQQQPWVYQQDQPVGYPQQTYVTQQPQQSQDWWQGFAAGAITIGTIFVTAAAVVIAKGVLGADVTTDDLWGIS